MEYFRRHCGFWELHCNYDGAIRIFQLHHRTVAETVPRLHCVQTCAKDGLSQPPIQDGNVCRDSRITLLHSSLHRASLPVILNLLGLWLVLFIFFAIMYMEVFGMTRWYSAESTFENYQSIGNTLLMLSFMSTGLVISTVLHSLQLTSFTSEGWNQYMHD